MDKDIFKYSAEILKNADSILITAGAGMGVDSGLPDFRGNEGFWKAYPPIAKLGLTFSEMANPQWFSHKFWSISGKIKSISSFFSFSISNILIHFAFESSEPVLLIIDR